MNDLGTNVFALLVELAGIKELSELVSMLHGLDQAIKNTLSVVGIVTIIFGVLQCFLGYKLFKFWCGLVGLFIGVVFGIFLATSGVFSGSPANHLIGFLLILIFGVTGAFIAFRLYIVGLFLYAFFAAFAIGFIALSLITDSITTGLLAGLLAGLTLGIVAVIFKRFWIILTTSVSGGISVGTSLMMILQTTDTAWSFIVPPLFIIAGFIVQMLTVKKTHEHKAVTYAYPQGTPDGGYPQYPQYPQPPQTPQQYQQSQQPPAPPQPQHSDPTATTDPLPKDITKET